MTRKSPLTVRQLRDKLQEYIVRSSRDGGEDELVIRSHHLHGSIGGLPCIAVTGMYIGFDWDMGKVFLETETPVRSAGEAFRREQWYARHMADELGHIWLILRNRDLDDHGKIKAIQRMLQRSRVERERRRKAET